MKSRTITRLLDRLRDCDDMHERCDYLMEHDEITYLLEYIHDIELENEVLRNQMVRMANPTYTYTLRGDGIGISSFKGNE